MTEIAHNSAIESVKALDTLSLRFLIHRGEEDSPHLRFERTSLS